MTCNDLATMAATLSNMGRHPITRWWSTRTRVKDCSPSCSRADVRLLGRVGVPSASRAKSGVEDDVMAVVVNRQLGIATYLSMFDQCGNTRRGIEVCIELASRLGLHVFDCLNTGSSYLSGIL